MIAGAGTGLGTDGSGRTPAGRSELLALAAVVALALLMRLPGLGSQALWYDESWTLDIASAPLGSLLGLISDWESTPPLFYLSAWSSVHLFGASEFAVRLPAAIAGVATVPAVWAGARELGGTRAALVAAALAACSPLMWWYSQEARAYSLAAAACAVVLLFMARACRTGSWADLAGWSAAVSLAILSQYPAVAVGIASAAVMAFFAPALRRRLVVVSLLPAATGLALIPLLADQLGDRRSRWIGAIPLQARLEQIASQAWFGSPASSVGAQWLLAAALGLALPIALAAGARMAGGPLGPKVLLPAAVAGGAVALLALASMLGRDVLLARNLIVAWPAAVVALACCVASIGRRFAIAFTAASCAAMLAVVAAVLADRDLQRIDFRDAAALLGAAPAGGRVVAIQSYPFSRPLNAYVPGLRRAGSGEVTTSEVALVSLDLPGPRWCWWGASCADGIRRSFSSRPTGRRELLGFSRSSVRTRGQFTVTLFRSRRPIGVSAASIGASLPPSSSGAVLTQR